MDATLDDRIEALHDVRPQLLLPSRRRRLSDQHLPPSLPLPPTAAQCARFGEAEDVSSLLAGGVPVDAVDQTGRTALFCAAANGHVLVLQLLLTHGAVRGDTARRNETLETAGPPIGC